MYNCDAETTSYYQDRDNYPTSHVCDRETLQAETRDELYEKIAQYRIENTRGVKTQYGEYDLTDFGPIYVIASSDDFSEDRLKATSAWKAHEAKLAEAARLAEIAEEDRLRKAAEAKLAKDRETYECLRAQFEGEDHEDR